MPIIAPPNPESRQISGLMTGLEMRMKRVEVGLRKVQLGNSSLEGSGINMFDANGNYRGTVGFQSDGTTTVTSQNPVPPPIPGAPSVSPDIACLIVKHSGETADGSGLPADFSHLNVYTADAGIPDVKTFRGTISPVPGQLIVSGLDYTNYFVDVTSVNLGGKESGHSMVSSGTPQMVVGQDILDGTITELNIAAGAVTEATIAANAVTTTKIADNSISTPKVIAGAIVAASIAADSIQTGHLTAQAVTASKIAALTITANEIAANAIVAGKIQAGSITASKLEANMIIATRIIAGVDGGPRVELHPTSGLQGYNLSGIRTLWLDASTGNFSATGSIQTSFSGQRIVMNPGGASPDTMRFYPSSGSAYASIDSITSGANYAGIMMYGATSGTKRGIVIAREDYASLLYADPANLFSTITTDIYANPSNAALRARVVDLKADYNQTPDPHIGLMCSNGTTIISSTLLYFNDSGFGEPHFAAINKDSGITFAGGKVYVVGNTVTVRRDFQANNIVYDGTLTPSGSDLKYNITPAQDLDVRQGVKYARGVRFQKTYHNEDAVYDADGNEIRGPVAAPVQLGLLADDLPPQVQATIKDFTPGGGDEVMAIDNQALLTLAWQGIGELWDKFDSHWRNPLPIPEASSAGVPLPASGCSLYCDSGSLYALFPSGKRVKIG